MKQKSRKIFAGKVSKQVVHFKRSVLAASILSLTEYWSDGVAIWFTYMDFISAVDCLKAVDF